MTQPLFRPGAIVSTPAALRAMHAAEANPAEYLRRHLTGDWGELDAHDVRENALALAQGYRIMSVYTLPGGVQIWLITEADRSATTFLLPDDY